MVRTAGTPPDQGAPEMVAFAPVRKVMWGTTPEENESLVGAVRRCAFDNGLPSVGILLREAVAVPHAWSNLALRDDVDVARLAEAMRTHAEEITARMHGLRRVAPFVALRAFHGAEIRGHDLRPGLRRIPAALPADGRHRALWHIGTIPFCRETGGMLDDRCARCERRLEWSAARRLNHCAICDEPARLTVDRRLKDRVLRETAPMTGLLDPCRIEAEAAEAALAPDLRAIGRGAAFDLGWTIARLFDARIDGARADDAALPAEVRIDVLRRGAQIIGDWPAALPSMLRVAVADDPARAKRVLRGLRSMVAARTGWPEQARLLERTVPELIARSRRVFGALHGPLINSDDARRRLRTEPVVLRRLVEAGALGVVDRTRSRRLCVGLDEGDVERLADLRSDCTSFAAAADALGITRAGVAQLVALGELKEPHDPGLDITDPGRRVSRSSLAALVSRIDALSTPVNDAGVVLRRAARAIGGEKPWGRILAAAANGTLPVARPTTGSGRSRLVDRIEVAVEDLLTLTALHVLAPDDGDAEVSRIDAGDVLSLTPRRLLDALGGELRHAVLANGRLSRKAVVAHARTHMSFAELSVRSGIGRRLITLLDADGVRRLGIAGWERSAAERWLRSGRS